MKSKTLDEVMKRLASQSPERLRRSVARAKAMLAGVEPVSGMPTSSFPPVRKGPTPPVAMRVKVHFARAKSAAAESDGPGSSTASRAKGDAFTAAFSVDELKQLRAVEPALLTWMAASKEHAARYFADPVGSLELAGVKLDPRLLRKIRQQRSRSLEEGAQLPHARVDSIDVDAKA